MQHITDEELDMISGAGWLRENFDDLMYITDNLNKFYKKAINATTDMMCTATGNC